MKHPLPDGLYRIGNRWTYVKNNNFINEHGQWQPCWTVPNGAFTPA